MLTDVQGFKLQLLHSSDNESSFQDPNTLEPKILHYGAALEGLRGWPHKRVWLVSTWPWVITHCQVRFTRPPPKWMAWGVPGLADIAFDNAMGLLANGMGNHEFDGGINDFARMLDSAVYPFLAVNLDFSQVQLEDGAPPIEIGEDWRQRYRKCGQGSQKRLCRSGRGEDRSDWPGAR